MSVHLANDLSPWLGYFSRVRSVKTTSETSLLSKKKSSLSELPGEVLYVSLSPGQHEMAWRKRILPVGMTSK